MNIKWPFRIITSILFMYACTKAHRRNEKEHRAWTKEDEVLYKDAVWHLKKIGMLR